MNDMILINDLKVAMECMKDKKEVWLTHPDQSYAKGASNPKDTPGTIIDVDSTWIRVYWKNDKTNSYRLGELSYKNTNPFKRIKLDSLYA